MIEHMNFLGGCYEEDEDEITTQGMTREEAREFLINLYDKLDAMAVKCLSEEDCEKVCEAIKVYMK